VKEQFKTLQNKYSLYNFGIIKDVIKTLLRRQRRSKTTTKSQSFPADCTLNLTKRSRNAEWNL